MSDVDWKARAEAAEARLAKPDALRERIEALRDRWAERDGWERFAAYVLDNALLVDHTAPSAERPPCGFCGRGPHWLATKGCPMRETPGLDCGDDWEPTDAESMAAQAWAEGARTRSAAVAEPSAEEGE